MEVNLDLSEKQLEIDATVANRSRNVFILSNQKTSIIVVLLVVAALFYVLKSNVDDTALYIWTSVCVLGYVLRYGLCSAFVNSDDHEKSEKKWQAWFTSIVIVSGLVWGSAAFFVFPESKTHQFFLVLVVLILSAGTIVTHSAYKLAAEAFAFACIFPFIVKFLLVGEKGLSEIAIILTLFLFLMISYGIRLRKIVNKIFFLSYENSKLIFDLQASNSELVEKNELLSETQNQLRQVNEELQKLATTDGLTGLINRRRFEALSKVKWSRCAETFKPLSLLIIDIDRFKSYNDFYGQRKGDACLISIGDMLKEIPEISRPSDSLARYSGGELAVLLFDADEEYAKSAAELIKREVESLRISRAELPNEPSLWLSVSIGVATESDFHERSSEDLFNAADAALHRAKKAGGNQVVLAGSY